MKKRLIALMMATCMAMAPVSCFAEDETDYSYLEDMTVNELKDLRDAINEILGDDGSSDGDIFAKHPEWKEYDTTIPPYSDAIFLTQFCKDSALNPSLFKIKEISYKVIDGKDYYYIAFYLPNKMGVQQYQSTVITMKDGDLLDATDSASDSDYYVELAGKKSDAEWLDVKFIENMLD